MHNSPRLPELYDKYAEKMEIVTKSKNVKKEINAAVSVIQLDELKCRKRVLRRFGFINDADVVQIKARVACEISTGDELLLTELLFNRFFNELTAETCAAMLSCFVFDEKQESPTLKEDLARPYREIQRQARIIAKVAQESKLALNEDEYVQGFKYQLVEVVHAWAQGRSFAEIWFVHTVATASIIDANHHSKMTDVYEGSLIRTFRRLEELLRQMCQAAKVMGSTDLEKRFEECLNKIKRDIVAAQSLYL